MAKRKIEIEITGKETASQILGKVDRALNKTEKEVKKTGSAFADFSRGAKEQFGRMAANFATQIPQMVGELFNLGVQSETVTQRFNAFAGSTEQAQAYLAAFQTATDGTVAKMDAMAGASKMLQMGLVDNADEMGTMAAVATKLGFQTMSAGDRIADFSALLANRSIPRLDNFGISSGKVRTRVEELKKAGHGLDEAFKLAVLEEGRKSLEILGDTSDLMSTKVDKLTAAVADLKVGIGEELAGAATDAVGDVDKFSNTIRTLIPTAGKLTRAIVNVSLTVSGISGILGALNNLLPKTADGFGYVAQAIEIQDEAMANATYTTSLAVRKAQGIDKISYLVDGATTSFRNFGKSQDETMHAVLDASEAMENEKLSIERVREAAIRTKEAMFDMGMSIFEQQKTMAEDVEGFASDKEKIESKHLTKMADLQKRGQSRAIKVNEEAEKKKLKDLQWNLDQAILQQSEFSDRTRESTRNAKEKQIEEMRTRVDEQAKLLDDYYAGRLIAQGANVSTEIAAEEARYATELEMLDASQAAQEEAQRASLGRMLITQFDAWAAMNGVAAEEAMEMRTAIALEYGLMDEKTAGTVNAAVASWGRWAGGSKKSAAEIVADVDKIINALGRIPRNVNVSISRTGGLGRLPGPAIQAQHGFSGWVGPGHGGARLFMAGEGSQAEYVNVTPGGGGGGGDITVIIEGSVMDDHSIEKMIRAVERVKRMRGTRSM